MYNMNYRNTCVENLSPWGLIYKWRTISEGRRMNLPDAEL